MSHARTTWSEHLKERAEKAAKVAACKTPGAFYNISIQNPKQTISVMVELPNSLPRLSAKAALALEEKLHRAVETSLAPLFKKLLKDTNND